MKISEFSPLETIDCYKSSAFVLPAWLGARRAPELKYLGFILYTVYNPMLDVNGPLEFLMV